MTGTYDTRDIKSWAGKVRAGDEILLSGVVYTARDAAHKKIAALRADGAPLPFDIAGAVIYYAGPTPAKPGAVCGSFGPTTSCRMDTFAPALYDLGLGATIGKGGRSEAVNEAIARNGALYLIAIGGAGAIAAKHIVSLEETAFEELGCESIKRLEFASFPLIVATDSHGNDIYKRERI